MGVEDRGQHGALADELHLVVATADLRAARDGSNPAYSGCGVQLLDDHHWEAGTGTILTEVQLTGSVYGAVAATDSRLLPDGAWNALEVLYQGTRLAVVLNGQVLLDVDTRAVGADPPFSARAPSGFVALQRYASGGVEGDVAVWIRDFYLREL